MGGGAKLAPTGAVLSFTRETVRRRALQPVAVSRVNPVPQVFAVSRVKPQMGFVARPHLNCVC